MHEPKDKKNRVHVVWDDIEEVEMDIKEVEDLFEVKSKKKAESTTKKAKPKDTKKKFFDADQSQKMSIILKRLPKPYIALEMLSKIDEQFAEKLQVSVINGLLRAWPDPSEAAGLFEEYEAHQNEKWDFAEDYIINLREVDNIKTKCEVLKYCLEYSEQEEFYLEPLEHIEEAFKEIEESKVLKEGLSVILTLGNILNGGHKTRGQADGFAIEGVTKIVSVKDVNNKSGMDFVCK